MALIQARQPGRLSASFQLTSARHEGFAKKGETIQAGGYSTLLTPKLGQKLRAKFNAANAAVPRRLHKVSKKRQACRTGAKADTQMQEGKVESATESVRLRVTPLTQENFAPFGQVCRAMPDGVEFGQEDAQLDLEGGVPRLYILRLNGKGLSFDRITHHARVTQCLGSADGGPWYMGVAPPSISSDSPDENGRLPWSPPPVQNVQVFKVEGPTFLKLNKGTWHAGPLFEDPQMDFYNLEHTDTNVTDHNTHVFARHDKVQFVIDDS